MDSSLFQIEASQIVISALIPSVSTTVITPGVPSLLFSLIARTAAATILNGSPILRVLVKWAKGVPRRSRAIARAWYAIFVYGPEVLTIDYPRHSLMRSLIASLRARCCVPLMHALAYLDPSEPRLSVAFPLTRSEQNYFYGTSFDNEECSSQDGCVGLPLGRMQSPNRVPGSQVAIQPFASTTDVEALFALVIGMAVAMATLIKVLSRTRRARAGVDRYSFTHSNLARTTPSGILQSVSLKTPKTPTPSPRRKCYPKPRLHNSSDSVMISVMQPDNLRVQLEPATMIPVDAKIEDDSFISLSNSLACLSVPSDSWWSGKAENSLVLPDLDEESVDFTNIFRRTPLYSIPEVSEDTPRSPSEDLGRPPQVEFIHPFSAVPSICDFSVTVLDALDRVSESDSLIDPQQKEGQEQQKIQTPLLSSDPLIHPIDSIRAYLAYEFEDERYSDRTLLANVENAMPIMIPPRCGSHEDQLTEASDDSGELLQDEMWASEIATVRKEDNAVLKCPVDDHNGQPLNGLSRKSESTIIDAGDHGSTSEQATEDNREDEDASSISARGAEDHLDDAGSSLLPSFFLPLGEYEDGTRSKLPFVFETVETETFGSPNLNLHFNQGAVVQTSPPSSSSIARQDVGPLGELIRGLKALTISEGTHLQYPMNWFQNIERVRARVRLQPCHTCNFS